MHVIHKPRVGSNLRLLGWVGIYCMFHRRTYTKRGSTLLVRAGLHPINAASRSGAM